MCRTLTKNNTKIQPTTQCSGQSIKVFSQLLRKARSRGFIVPTIKPSRGGPGGGLLLLLLLC